MERPLNLPLVMAGLTQKGDDQHGAVGDRRHTARCADAFVALRALMPNGFGHGDGASVSLVGAIRDYLSRPDRNPVCKSKARVDSPTGITAEIESVTFSRDQVGCGNTSGDRAHVL